jgi:hypothetical protein
LDVDNWSLSYSNQPFQVYSHRHGCHGGTSRKRRNRGSKVVGILESRAHTSFNHLVRNNPETVIDGWVSVKHMLWISRWMGRRIAPSTSWRRDRGRWNPLLSEHSLYHTGLQTSCLPLYWGTIHGWSNWCDWVRASLDVWQSFESKWNLEKETNAWIHLPTPFNIKNSKVNLNSWILRSWWSLSRTRRIQRHSCTGSHNFTWCCLCKSSSLPSSNFVVSSRWALTRRCLSLPSMCVSGSNDRAWRKFLIALGNKWAHLRLEGHENMVLSSASFLHQYRYCINLYKYVTRHWVVWFALWNHVCWQFVEEQSIIDGVKAPKMFDALLGESWSILDFQRI